MKYKVKSKTYLLLLVDRKHARIFTLFKGIVESKGEYIEGNVPQKVKHGDDTWDSPDKIFRHTEDHLHRYLIKVRDEVEDFVKNNRIDGIIIGSHRPLFPKIKKLFNPKVRQKIKGTFVTELKAPFNEILRRAKNVIEELRE